MNKGQIQTYNNCTSLDTEIQVSVEKSVADKLKVMAEHMNKTEGEIVNIAMKRFIATHSDYFPKPSKLS